MAMTKIEQKRVADLEQGLAMARAMRWPEYNMPAPLTRAEIEANLDGVVCRGWFANSYSRRVTLGVSSGYHHNTVGLPTNSQGMGRMFNSEVDAWRAVRYELTEKVAKELAEIDAKIAGLLP